MDVVAADRAVPADRDERRPIRRSVTVACRPGSIAGASLAARKAIAPSGTDQKGLPGGVTANVPATTWGPALLLEFRASSLASRSALPPSDSL
ncbi:hypothetical protein MMIN_35040 [Mycolicibacter minnesotensis]|nr:hypothetical protein MMIN_35040 [Mycolicibacter minnesotensis]